MGAVLGFLLPMDSQMLKAGSAPCSRRTTPAISGKRAAWSRPVRLTNQPSIFSSVGATVVVLLLEEVEPTPHAAKLLAGAFIRQDHDRAEAGAGVKPAPDQ